MWKKGEHSEPERPGQRETLASTDGGAAPARSTGQAIIGRSITIRGEVTGDEDLVIQGRVDGSVELEQHSVTVGPQGQVKANINARVVTIEGRVEGNVTGDEQVVLRKASWVLGDIQAPRVVLEDGAQFRGGVLMGEDLALSRRVETFPVGKAPVEKAPVAEAARQPAPPRAMPAQPVQGAARAATAAKTADVKG